MSRVAVVGVGSVGAFFAAALLERDDHDVVLCVRRPFDELVVETDGRSLRSTPDVRTGAEGLEPVDWVLLGVKAHQTEAAAPWLRALAGPGTAVAVLQNGVEHVERVAPLVGEATVVPTVVYCGAEQVAPGHVVHRSHGFLQADDDDGGRALASLFDGTIAGVRLTGDMATALWTKLASNVVGNGITALTLRRLDVFAEPSIEDLAAALSGEVAAVARAQGADLPGDLGVRMARTMAGGPPDGGTSMLYDRLAGRPLEHDAIHGAVLRAAARHGIDVPITTALHALLAASAPPPA